jgi:hypothetical protein
VAQRNWGRVSDPAQAASSGSHNKAPGSAGGYLLSVITTGLVSYFLEKYKSQLSWKSRVREILYTRFHERRFEVVTTLFPLLVRTETRFSSILKMYRLEGEPTEDEQTEEAGKAAQQYMVYFAENELFLDGTLLEKLKEFNKKILDAWIDIGSRKTDGKIFIAAIKKYQMEVPKLLIAIREEMQRTLRVPQRSDVTPENNNFPVP